MFCYFQQLEQFAKHMRLDVCYLLGMNDVWYAETRNKLVELAGNNQCLFVLQCVRLDLFCEVIDDWKNVSVFTLSAWKQANSVHGHALKWRSRVDRSKFSAVAKVSFVMIASKSFLSLVLDVFTNH